jgi:hypothetical protein
MRYTTSFCDALDAVLHEHRQKAWHEQTAGVQAGQPLKQAERPAATRCRDTYIATHVHIAEA